MRILTLISFLIFSTLSPVAFSGMSPDSCCDEHVESESTHVAIHTTDHDPDTHPEDCCTTDCCACHSPTNQVLCSSTLTYFSTERNLILEKFNSPEPVFLSTPLRPPIS